MHGSRFRIRVPLRSVRETCKILYTYSVSRISRPIEFRGRAPADLSRFPDEARREAGFQLYQVQEGIDPDDWKPMTAIGIGVREIRIRGRDGIFRILYVANLANAVYVLHCFQEKSQKTSTEDIDLASRRYKELIRELNQ